MDLNNTGAMRSPFSPRVRQSISGRRPIGISSAKKNQSKFMHAAAAEQAGDIIYKTPLMTVQTYGQPLPVMVTEALTFSSGDISVRVSPCGWCWVVTGRRILAWPLVPASTDPDSPAHTTSLAARELTLPQTDLSHKADLVMLFYEDGAQMPSCIGVSPEGVVRYWSSVGQEMYVDVSCELAGQECERLVRAAGRLVLATTTCSLVLLHTTLIEGRATVSCRTMRPPSGWLGGIGRRVSHLFFGSMPAHADTKLVGVVGLGEDTVALVASGPLLQLWRGGELHEHELRRALLHELHLPPHGEQSVELTTLDVQAAGEHRLLLLLALGNVARHDGVRYSIAHISVEDASSPRVTSVCGVRAWAGAGEPAPRLLALPPHALLYCSAYICAVLYGESRSSSQAEWLPLSAEGDELLGAVACGGRPLLLSRAHGLLALALHADTHDRPDRTSVCESPLGSPCPSDMYDGNLSLYEIDPHEVSKVATDACSKLKTAFLFHVRRDTAACRAILHELFPTAGAGAGAGAGDEPDVDALLDRTVVQIATEMLDDMPAGDPRWKSGGGATTTISLGRSAALQIAAQLQDKKRAFTLLLDFLRLHRLWPRLASVYVEGAGVCRTESVLRALAERLAAAAALRALQRGPAARLLDAAVYRVACADDADEEPAVEAALAAGALSPSDVCYRRVSRAPRLLVALCRAHADDADAERALDVLQTVCAGVSAMQAVRAQWQCAPAPAPAHPALVPALRDALLWAVTSCAHECGEAALRAQLLESAARLAALLLEEAAPLRLADHTRALYEDIRRDVVACFLSEGQTERAAALAERYRALEPLVQLCADTDDMGRLARYIDLYADEGMAELAYEWLWSRGGRQRAALVSRLGAGGRLRAWLAAEAAPARAPLAALHALHAADPQRAADLLQRWARRPHRPHALARFTTISSLSKLCLVACEGAEGAGAGEGQAGEELARRVEDCLYLAAQNAALPRALLDRGDDPHRDRTVMPVEKLLELYIESEDAALTEYDYKKALELADRLPDPDLREDYALRVWCACVLRSQWDGEGEDSDANMFARLLHIVLLTDEAAWVPTAEQVLTSRRLAALAADPRLHYRIKLQLHSPPSPRSPRSPAPLP